MEQHAATPALKTSKSLWWVLLNVEIKLEVVPRCDARPWVGLFKKAFRNLEGQSVRARIQSEQASVVVILWALVGP